MSKYGPKIDPRREFWVKELNLTYRQSKKLTYYFLAQLDQCQDMAARRLLIRGVCGHRKDSNGRPVRTTGPCKERA